jgi:hypothetical protein
MRNKLINQLINPDMKIICTLLVTFLLAVPLVNSQSKYYFISTSGNDSNSGLSVKEAWKTLDKVNQVTFQPGDNILFESGGIWFGQLFPQGSGVEGKPIILTSYGDGNKPVINIGRAEGAGIRLTNQSWWEISNMEITSYAPPEIGIGRQGIVVVAKGEGQKLKHIVIRNNYIHDIWGQMGGNTEYVGYYSCAILVNIQRDRNRDITRAFVPNTIDDVLIENNRIERFDKCGIISWGPRNNVIVRNNVMDNLGGDGIFVNGTYRGLIEHNIVRRSCMRSGNLDIPGSEGWWPHTAAIWIQNALETVMQFNEVYDTGRELTNGDGNAYDFDFNCVNCTLQYNYSKNNHGFLLIMNRTFGNIVRYNISENDKTHLIQFQCDTTDRNIIHNNVFYVDYGTADFDYHSGDPDKSKLGATMRNNIFYATGQGRFRTVYSQGPMLSRQFDDSTKLQIPENHFYNNCYFGPWKNGLPEDPKKLVADPMFIAPGTGGTGLNSLGGYKLKPESPVINAGVFIPMNSIRDFFGNPVQDGSVDIGAYEQIGSGVFADKALEERINNTAMIRNRLAVVKRNFPLTIPKPQDGRIVINIREPLDNHITGTISLNGNDIKAKPAAIVLEKAKDRNSFVFTLPKNTQSLENVYVQILLDDNGIREEWVIPIVEQTVVRRPN